MPKGTVLQDTFERLAELGSSGVKKSAKTVQQIVSPTTIIEQVTGLKQGELSPAEKAKKELKENPKSTPLDFEKLKAKYEDQDKQKQDQMRQRLFQLVKEGEKQVLHAEKQEVQQAKQTEAQQEEQKKRKEEEAKKKQEQEGAALPSGKKRRSIFSPKKKSAAPAEVRTETKPGSSKN